MRRTLLALVATLALFVVFPPTPALAAAGIVATVVHTIDTSNWSPPSPDPSGLTYRASTGRILTSDSEVDEIPALFTGQNLFEHTPGGTLLDTGNTSGNGTSTKSLEAADVAWDNAGQVLYVSDDDLDKVFRYNPQGDGRVGTADDTSAVALSLNGMGINDAEGLAYQASDRSLFIADGISATIYHVQRGSDGQFGPKQGVNDDIVTHFDAAAVGMRDPEDLEYDPATDRLYIASRIDDAIAETTTTGTLVHLIDVSSANVNPSGITLAPGSNAPTETHLYVADRGVDNDVDPQENDGKIVEFALSASNVNDPPVLTKPENQFNIEGDTVSLQVVASDPEGSQLTYSATGLPTGLGIDQNTGLISGTISAGASGGSVYGAQVSVTDGNSNAAQNFSWTVTLNNHAPQLTSPSDQNNVEGDLVSLQVVATDPDGNPLTYTATNLPPGLAIDPGTGLISGSVSVGASTGSPYNVQLDVSDGQLHDADTFPWTVTAVPPSAHPPVVTNPGSQSNFEGDAVNLQIQATDADGDTLTYSSVGLPPGLFMDLSTGLISGTISPGAASQSPYSVQVSASDGHDTDTQSFMWNVTPVAHIALRGVSSVFSAAGAKVKALTISTPGGVQVGDVLVAAIDVRSSAKITPPAGWTAVKNTVSGSVLRQSTYVRVVSGSVPASSNFTLGANAVAVGVIAAYSGVSNVSPVVVSGAKINASSTSIATPSVTAPTPGSMLVGMFGIATNATMTPAAGMVERADLKTGQANTKLALEVADDTLESSGPSGVRSATASAAAVSIGTLIVLRPA